MKPTPELLQAIKKYRTGNVKEKNKAFDVIYSESYKYIYTCVYRAVSGNDNEQDIIKEVMQETYIEICKSFEQLKDDEAFLSWGARIAASKYSLFFKKADKYILLEEEDKTFENLSDSDDIIPEEIMQNKEKRRLIREIINTELTQMQKLCITAYYYSQMKQSEIAENLGIPENTVKTNLSRAKAKIEAAVLNLEKNKGTKLYSVAPFMLLLLRDEVQTCVVPMEINKAVLNTVMTTITSITTGGTGIATEVGSKVVNATITGSKSAGTKGILAKLTAMSVKAKIIASVATVGFVGAAVGVTVLGIQELQRSKMSIPEDAGSFKGHHYYVYEFEDYTWDDAKEYCESLGGHLVTVSDEMENEYIYQLMREQGYESAYLGLSDAKEEGVWKWVTGEKVKFTNWSIREPNGEHPEEDYAMFFYWNKTSVWNDGDFGVKTSGGHKSFICEWDR